MNYADYYLKEAWELYAKEMNSRDNRDYEVNHEQMQKLVAAYGFFSSLAAAGNGKVDPFRLVPKEVNGGVTAYFTVFYISGDDIRRFCEIIGSASSLSIDSLTDGLVCISFTIPNVFRRK